MSNGRGWGRGETRERKVEAQEDGRMQKLVIEYRGLTAWLVLLVRKMCPIKGEWVRVVVGYILMHPSSCSYTKSMICGMKMYASLVYLCLSPSGFPLRAVEVN